MTTSMFSSSHPLNNTQTPILFLQPFHYITPLCFHGNIFNADSGNEGGIPWPLRPAADKGVEGHRALGERALHHQQLLSWGHSECHTSSPWAHHMTPASETQFVGPLLSL